MYVMGLFKIKNSRLDRLKQSTFKILPQKNKIKFWLNLSKGQLKDPNNLARDVSKIGH